MASNAHGQGARKANTPDVHPAHHHPAWLLLLQEYYATQYAKYLKVLEVKGWHAVETVAPQSVNRHRTTHLDDTLAGWEAPKKPPKLAEEGLATYVEYLGNLGYPSGVPPDPR